MQHEKTIKYEEIKSALMAGHNVSFTFELDFCQHHHPEVNNIIVTGRQRIESYMIYRNIDSMECIAFSTQHLTITSNGTPVIEISKYVIKNTDAKNITLKNYFLAPHDYSALKDPLFFEGNLGESFIFILHNSSTYNTEK
ncbi:VirK family protein [Enterobacter bugandensis]|uniref:VirK family protein n=1 Tax=Enterobacter bugandensis TaxID=881260 RepID=UPI0021CFC40D|nr:VirK family protein [Enterobacter bugandensis]MCU6162265.1 VirK family protein [Enterobacter bugandensis]